MKHMEMTVRFITEACGGRLLSGDPEAAVTSVSADSRGIKEGALFVPIVGEKTDAHRFIPDVFKAGAAASFTQEPSKDYGEKAVILVKDTLRALQDTAAAYRRAFHIPFIGVTGSAGKTTTREMTALALSSGLNVMKTQGNLNSQVGLPLTLFTLSARHEAAVMEMGMSNFGEMGRLAGIARPDFAVITNIGLSHIGQLKTKENILKEKLHITDFFGRSSTLFLNGDDSMLAALKGSLPFDTVYYGTGENSAFRAVNIEESSNSSKFQFIPEGGAGVSVTLPVPGRHYISDALAALAVCSRLNVPLGKAAAALSSYSPLAMRQQVLDVNGITVIDDSYNSSPDALNGSLDVLAGFRGGRRIAVLADMLELGGLSRRAHYEAGAYAARAGIDGVIAIGDYAADTIRGARSVLPGMHCGVSAGNTEAEAALKNLLRHGDTVLVKGSRGMHTDEIVKWLKKTYS